MRLLVPVERLEGYDEDLLRAFFFGGRKETDTDAVRKHYKSSGFDPVSKIKPGLEATAQEAAGLPGRGADARPGGPRSPFSRPGRPRSPSRSSAAARTADRWSASASSTGSSFSSGRSARASFRSASTAWISSRCSFCGFPCCSSTSPGPAARDGVRSSLLLIAGVLLVRLGIVNSVFNIAKIRSGSKRIARRKALASARNYFARELARSEPRLKDEWFPLRRGLRPDERSGPLVPRARRGRRGARARSAWSGSTSSSSSSSSLVGLGLLERRGRSASAAPARRAPGPWPRARWQRESPRPPRRAAGAAGAGAAGEARAAAAGEAGEAGLRPGAPIESPPWRNRSRSSARDWRARSARGSWPSGDTACASTRCARKSARPRTRPTAARSSSARTPSAPTTRATPSGCSSARWRPWTRW